MSHPRLPVRFSVPVDHNKRFVHCVSAAVELYEVI
jgi:hypothetical protein